MKLTYSPGFDSDSYPQKVVGYSLSAPDSWCETPKHSHTKGQLVVPLCGYVQVQIDSTLWVVPNGNAIWIPGKTYHNCIFSSKAQACVLFIDPDLMILEDKGCTLDSSLLLRELIIRFTEQNQEYSFGDATDRLAAVIIDELQRMKITKLNFPLPLEPRLKYIAHRLLQDPADRSTVAQWALEVAMSESSLVRLVKQETSMSFGRWRGQLRALIALQCLSTGESVQSVADKVGYESMSAFITFFKNTFGCAPSKYMQMRT